MYERAKPCSEHSFPRRGCCRSRRRSPSTQHTPTCWLLFSSKRCQTATGNYSLCYRSAVCTLPLVRLGVKPKCTRIVSSSTSCSACQPTICTRLAACLALAATTDWTKDLSRKRMANSLEWICWGGVWATCLVVLCLGLALRCHVVYTTSTPLFDAPGHLPNI